MNLQTILMIFFFQRGRWVRMVGKEKKKSWGTSTETLKPPNMLCLTRTRSLPSVSEIVQHPVGNTYIKPCNTSRKNASMYFTAKSCRGAPCTDSRHSSWFHAVSILLSSAPTLCSRRPSEARLSRDHLLFLQPLPRMVTLSQHLPDKKQRNSLPFSCIWPFPFPGYLKLCIHTPSSSILTFYT